MTNKKELEKENWLKEKITLTMTRKEFSELGNVFADAQYNEVDFTKIRDRKIRKMFAKIITKRHNFWLKIQRLMK